ncbi:MAG: dehydrogenase [Deltaproteobacteria bacterium RIFCSPLOWO2_01_44_7]|nr:MAG: dehydrogenase [Deltaproteobacteria bacterium RIFCSPHIGHO2_01_FULL_43_49]OGQ16094.1 MAG: dehydrogenase [Deltaproteobacteria bacterium RIFCSPHIGHO2_02_FULL_44_53]OGQ29055.1 MAG: dehydrogenase [Deltaproteobacteria bacterium RIFCSPHIGHO2_12_FULL_44_21]OGQ32611.1 MAG: dehydrogenase [Deltaproteobacteria bacterium RIFCSPLOWO2_01_FULL_45_74]OGQ38353.1 MAG: dehydrogenase [Deltaproteobacteria bacterium RIFCSPLOWO2_01_44_7]OGQ41712.1 MAG: dehydrogenase [Deltaproteobacteria bacterium RIFCSPLOWO2_0
MPLKKALVTGGTRGIGFAIAEALLKAGYEVSVTGTDPSGKGPKGSSYFACDFSDLSVMEKFAKEIAEMKWDVLVNNAGINKVGPIPDYNPKDFETIQQVNLTAPFLLCQAVLPGMCQRRYGRIVNITSLFSVVSREGRFAYSASKSGLAGMTRALALEAAKDNVLINCVAPGFIDTDLSQHVLGEKGMQEVALKIPMKRLAKPSEIAAWVRFLVSDENTYMTGQNIVIDGGYTCE